MRDPFPPLPLNDQWELGAAVAARNELGPVGFEPTTKGFTVAPAFPPGVDYLFTRACSVSKRAGGCGMLEACHQGRLGHRADCGESDRRTSPQVVSAPSAGVPAARLRIAMSCG